MGLRDWIGQVSKRWRDSHTQDVRPVFEQLEQRVLLSTDPLGLGGVDPWLDFPHYEKFQTQAVIEMDLVPGVQLTEDREQESARHEQSPGEDGLGLADLVSLTNCPINYYPLGFTRPLITDFTGQNNTESNADLSAIDSYIDLQSEAVGEAEKSFNKDGIGSDYISDHAPTASNENYSSISQIETAADFNIVQQNEFQSSITGVLEELKTTSENNQLLYAENSKRRLS